MLVGRVWVPSVSWVLHTASGLLHAKPAFQSFLLPLISCCPQSLPPLPTSLLSAPHDMGTALHDAVTTLIPGPRTREPSPACSVWIVTPLLLFLHCLSAYLSSSWIISALGTHTELCLNPVGSLLSVERGGEHQSDAQPTALVFQCKDVGLLRPKVPGITQDTPAALGDLLSCTE